MHTPPIFFNRNHINTSPSFWFLSFFLLFTLFLSSAESCEKFPSNKPPEKLKVKNNLVMIYYNMADLHHTGKKGVQKDCVKAKEFYEKALERDKTFSQAMHAIGKLYYSGCDGIERNFKIALNWFKKADKNGDLSAAYNIGLMYKYGLGVEKDYKKAFSWYEKAAKNGVAVAINDIALMYDTGNGVKHDSKKALECFEKAAQMGSLMAQYNLANIYENSDDVVQDYEKSLYWYKKSAKKGLTLSQGMLAYKYRHGIGVKKDIKIAIKWYVQGAKNGDLDAQTQLAMMYEEGIDVEKNLELAIKLYKKGAKQNFPRALTRLARAYDIGYGGLEQNPQKAEAYYTKAIDISFNNFFPVTNELFGLENKGIGDMKRIARITRIFAKKGLPKAQFSLAMHYKKGVGVERDDKKAVKWLKEAASNNIPDAMAILSRYYDDDGNIEKAQELAKEASYIYFNKSATRFNLNPAFLLQDSLINRRQHFIHVLDMMARKKNGLNADDINLAFKIMQYEHSQRDRFKSYLNILKPNMKSTEKKVSKKLEQLRNNILELQVIEQQYTQNINSHDKKNLHTAPSFYVRNQLNSNIKRLSSQLQNRFGSTGFMNTEPLTLKNIQALLQEDEALLLYLFGVEDFGSDHRSFALLIEKDGKPKLIPLEIDENELNEVVLAIRKSVTIILVPDTKPPRFTNDPFATEKAFNLYQKIFKPVEKELDNKKNIIVVADKILHRLPLNLLIRELPDINNYDDYRHIDWLVNHFSISRLPSIQSLPYIRSAHSKRGFAKWSFLGIGDPVLNDKKNTLTRGSPLLMPPAKLRENYGNLDHSGEELKTLADILQTPLEKNTHLLTKEDANESAIKALNLSDKKHPEKPTLSDFRVIAFSTHGILASESHILGGPELPGLVLTPPKKSSKENDGYLTSIDVAHLTLNAEQVILSACNTGVSENTISNPSNGISELSDAFLFAGSRSVLASQWYVDDKSTAQLTKNMFKNLKNNPKLKRVEALQASIKDIINHGVNCNWLCRSLKKMGFRKAQAQYAHPIYWAPFVIYGENGMLPNEPLTMEQ